MNSSKPALIVIGGGAAGICAALGAASERESLSAEFDILLLERNPRLGIKIRISGGGKCNITHAGETEAILKEGFLRTNEERFLKHALYNFTNEDALALLERHGVRWHARENGRIFPDSGRADDVLEAFETELAQHNIEVRTSTRVVGMRRHESSFEVVTPDAKLVASAIILATGGISYSKTGTTGDGLKYSAQLGHTIVPLRSALAPIYLKQKPPDELQGVAIRDVELGILQNGKIIGSKRGDVLITQHGLSGPATLDISRDATEALERGEIKMVCNLLGEKTESIRMGLEKLQQDRSPQQITTWLAEALPNRLVPNVLQAAEIPQDRRWNALTRVERDRLLKALSEFPFGEVSEVPIERGEVTAGGVLLKEMDSKTMASRKIPGLFIAGEMLDIAGEIGGFNLQAAYSTGWTAGKSAAKFLWQNHPISAN